MLFAASAAGAEYWVAWEGDDLPENQGWTRAWGDGQGQYHGQGAHRTLAHGMLTYDSLFDPNVHDLNEMIRPGQMQPGPGEKMVVEWGLLVSQVVGYCDPGVTVSSDDGWCMGMEYSYDRVYSLSESFLAIPFAPGVMHDYRWISSDMRSYDLYIDGLLVHHGPLRYAGVFPSEVLWGDAAEGVASLHTWDYFRFGIVTPEPGALFGIGLMCASRTVARTRRLGTGASR